MVYHEIQAFSFQRLWGIDTIICIAIICMPHMFGNRPWNSPVNVFDPQAIFVFYYCYARNNLLRLIAQVMIDVQGLNISFAFIPSEKCIYILREKCMYSSDELFQRSQEGYCGVFSSSWEATREINTRITLEWEQKLFITSVHTLFYFLHDITNP